jgi:hypothetical protein
LTLRKLRFVLWTMAHPASWERRTGQTSLASYLRFFAATVQVKLADPVKPALSVAVAVTL